MTIVLNGVGFDMIIHLNGMPGVGKYTVGKLLAAELHARLIDNHLIIDLVSAMHDRGTLSFFPTVMTYCRHVADSIRQAPVHPHYIFTNALAADFPEDVERLQIVEQLAQDVGMPFVPVLLTCELDENKKRLIEPERSRKGKLMDVDVFESINTGYTLLHPWDHPNALHIDTTELSPEDVAARVKGHIGAVAG